MLLFCRLFEVQFQIFGHIRKKTFLLSIFTVVSIKIEYSIGGRVAHRVFFNSMSYRFVVRLGSGISISGVEISGIFENL
jgi:hypothetical protein